MRQSAQIGVRYEGDKGVRDFTITRTKTGKFVILATDLSLSYGMPYQYENSWEKVSRNGSKCLVMWQSEDLVHRSSSHSCNDFGPKGIFYSRTKDFEEFSAPEELYRKEDGGPVIDSAMYEEGGKYYCFLKSEGNPSRVILVEGDNVTGPFHRVEAFDRSMAQLEEGLLPSHSHTDSSTEPFWKSPTRSMNG